MSTRALLALAGTLACSAQPAQPPAPAAQRALLAAPSAPVPVVTAQAANAAPTATSGLEQRLREHFAQYRDGSSFDFIERDWAAHVERYLTLRDVSSAELVRAARAFYADKTHIALTPEAASLQVTDSAGKRLASFVLKLEWSTQPPAAAAGCGYLDDCMQWHPGSLIEHRARVSVKLTLDAAERFVAYEEQLPIRRQLLVNTRGDGLTAFPSLPVGPARQIEPPPAAKLLNDGTLVEDLGDTFTCGLSSAEVDTVRRVRAGNATVWLLDHWVYDTGHNFVGDDLLVAAPTPSATPTDRAADTP